ncbi:hypothetical protein Ancab_026624 [Ancistrocladus abbreviatus]
MQFATNTVIIIIITQLLANFHNDRSLVSSSYAMAISVGQRKGIPALLVFGDPIVDSGNNNYIPTICKVNFLPCGRDFDGGNKPTGRFSNGRIPFDFLAEELGMKEFMPAYLDLTLRNDDFFARVNFASGHSSYDVVTATSNEDLALSLMGNQFEMFKGYAKRLETAVGEERTRSIISKSLYFIATGSNDIFVNYYSSTVRSKQYTIDSYMDLLITFGSGFLEDLYGEGARRMILLSLPPLGCLPYIRTELGGLLRYCVEERIQVSAQFNSILKTRIDSLNRKLPGAKIVYFEAYNSLLDLVNDLQKSGFLVRNRGCCGIGLFELGFLCNKWNPFTCKNASQFVFWDSFHPTEAVYRLAIDQAVKNGILDLF